METIFRKCTAEDAGMVQRLARDTFYDTFASANRSETMQDYLREAFGEDKIQEELENPDSSFYVLWSQGTPAGYLKLNQGMAQTELQDPAALEIERIYLTRTCQGQGLGQIMMDFALETARKLGKDYVWLGVWENNKTALAFYARNGFCRFSEHKFVLGDEIQTDYLMRKELQSKR